VQLLPGPDVIASGLRILLQAFQRCRKALRNRERATDPIAICHFTGRLGLAGSLFRLPDFHFEIGIFPRYEDAISYRDMRSAKKRGMHFTL
jgi:hypothetical protein